MENNPPALELVGITKRFGQFHALKNVDFSVQAGAVHGLCGENGAGKSTLIKILDGQYASSSYEGDLRVGGRPVELSTPHDARQNGIAVVPQESNVIDTLTIAENIVLGNWPGGRIVRQQNLRTFAAEFLATIGIDLDARKLAGTLSASGKQLLMIARALHTQPRILLLDEPTTALTESEVDKLYNIVSDLRRHGVTVLLISHKLEEITHLCDEVSVLKDGEMVDRIPRASLTSDRLIRAMLGRDLTHLYPERERTPGDPLLEVEGISIKDPRVPGRLAVDQATLTVRAGEVVGIGGQLGSGRSELLLGLVGALPRTGTVSVRGNQVPANRPGSAAKAGIAFVPEERKTEGLLFDLNIAANVTLSALSKVRRRGLISRKVEARAATTFIDRFRIAGASPKAFLSTLSGGNQQKVLLSRALFTEPSVVLLDEPTKGVDVAAKAEIYRLIESLARTGMAILVVSSELPELLGNCDRIYLMNRGRITQEFDASMTTREQLLEAAISGKVVANVN